MTLRRIEADKETVVDKNAQTVGPVDRQIGVAQSHGDGRPGAVVSECVADHRRGAFRLWGLGALLASP